MADDKGFTLWFTGLSGAGKTTITKIVEDELRERGLPARGARRRRRPRAPLQGPRLLQGGPRHQHPPDRLRRRPALPQRRAGDHRRDLALPRDPRRGARADGRPLRRGLRRASLEVCDERDIKGLYAKALSGEIKEFTGVSDPYEPPVNPELRSTPSTTPPRGAAKILAHLEERQLIPAAQPA